MIPRERWKNNIDKGAPLPRQKKHMHRASRDHSPRYLVTDPDPHNLLVLRWPRNRYQLPQTSVRLPHVLLVRVTGADEYARRRMCLRRTTGHLTAISVAYKFLSSSLFLIHCTWFACNWGMWSLPFDVADYLRHVSIGHGMQGEAVERHGPIHE